MTDMLTYLEQQLQADELLDLNPIIERQAERRHSTPEWSFPRTRAEADGWTDLMWAQVEAQRAQVEALWALVEALRAR